MFLPCDAPVDFLQPIGMFYQKMPTQFTSSKKEDTTISYSSNSNLFLPTPFIFLVAPGCMFFCHDLVNGQLYPLGAGISILAREGMCRVDTIWHLDCSICTTCVYGTVANVNAVLDLDRIAGLPNVCSPSPKDWQSWPGDDGLEVTEQKIREARENAQKRRRNPSTTLTVLEAMLGHVGRNHGATVIIENCKNMCFVI